MTDNPDHTRRWLINVSGAAMLSNVLPVAPALAQAAPAAKPAAPEAAEDGVKEPRCRRSRWRSPSYISGTLDRELPAAVVAKTKMHVLDTVAAMVSGSRLKRRPRGRPLCGRPRRQAAGDRDRHRPAHLDRQCGARQRHGGAWRRDRQFPSQGPLPSRLRHRAGGARHRGTRRPQRQRCVARGRARLRHRGALDLCARLRRALYRAAQHPHAWPPPSARPPRPPPCCGSIRPRCATRSRSRPSRAPAFPIGSATASISRRRSISAAWGPATASPPPPWWPPA